MKYLLENLNNISEDNTHLFHHAKKEKIEKAQTLTARKQSILGEQLLIKGLQIFYHLSYSKLNFTIHNSGKPYILGNPIYYNISHSHDYCICAFSETEIGVDIEKIRVIDKKTISFFATTKEEQYIFQSNIDINKRAFEIFTLKEAYFKMLGTGITDLKNVEFQIDDMNINCSDSKAKLWFSDELDDYVIAFCEKKVERV